MQEYYKSFGFQSLPSMDHLEKEYQNQINGIDSSSDKFKELEKAYLLIKLAGAFKDKNIEKVKTVLEDINDKAVKIPTELVIQSIIGSFDSAMLILGSFLNQGGSFTKEEIEKIISYLNVNDDYHNYLRNNILEKKKKFISRLLTSPMTPQFLVYALQQIASANRYSSNAPSMNFFINAICEKLQEHFIRGQNDFKVSAKIIENLFELNLTSEEIKALLNIMILTKSEISEKCLSNALVNNSIRRLPILEIIKAIQSSGGRLTEKSLFELLENNIDTAIIQEVISLILNNKERITENSLIKAIEKCCDIKIIEVLIKAIEDANSESDRSSFAKAISEESLLKALEKRAGIDVINAIIAAIDNSRKGILESKDDQYLENYKVVLTEQSFHKALDQFQPVNVLEVIISGIEATGSMLSESSLKKVLIATLYESGSKSEHEVRKVLVTRVSEGILNTGGKVSEESLLLALDKFNDVDVIETIINAIKKTQGDVTKTSLAKALRNNSEAKAVAAITEAITKVNNGILDLNNNNQALADANLTSISSITEDDLLQAIRSNSDIANIKIIIKAIKESGGKITHDSLNAVKENNNLPVMAEIINAIREDKGFGKELVKLPYDKINNDFCFFATYTYGADLSKLMQDKKIFLDKLVANNFESVTEIRLVMEAIMSNDHFLRIDRGYFFSKDSYTTSYKTALVRLVESLSSKKDEINSLSEGDKQTLRSTLNELTQEINTAKSKSYFGNQPLNQALKQIDDIKRNINNDVGESSQINNSM